MADLRSLAVGADLHGLAVEADLRLEVTTASGASTSAVVTGDGQLLRVDAARPEVLFDVVDRADAGRIADLLADAGITVAVHGPRGSIATLGAGASSRLGRAVTGSTRVAPAPRAAVALVSSRRASLVAAVAVPLLLAVLAVASRFLGRSRRPWGSS